MAAGKVVEWKSSGYGFIAPDSSDRDVFFHASDVVSGQVPVGARVEFEVQDTERGTRAVKVRRADQAPPGPELVADVLTGDELWAELEQPVREAVLQVARKHNWVEG